jgi:deoxyadenosine/deoxycytidine kinase
MHWRAGRITDAEYTVYQMIMDEEVAGKLIEPDYMVFLDCSKDKALARIKKRGRPGEYEAYRKDDYLMKLRTTFHEVFTGVTVNYIDYEDDHLDEQFMLPQVRLAEILGILRDRTFEQVGIPASYNC